MSKKLSDLEMIFEGFEKGQWVWCLHCERCYQVGEYRPVKGLQLCPYADCDGSPLDAWHWEQIREAHPEYPKVPERNKVYFQY